MTQGRGRRILWVGFLMLLGTVPAIVADTSKACAQVGSEAEVRVLLQKWRDQIKPGLPAQEVKLVEKQASAAPLDIPADQVSLTFDDSETNAGHRVEVNAGRRDMVYALAGYGYTLVGGSYAGQQKMKDMGLWCFLEAALLRMISPHLLNVSFHLNERGAYDDASAVLCYAMKLDPNSAPAHNNLAYNLAAQGQFKDAVNEAAEALSLAPEKDTYVDRLKYYGQKAGIKVDNLVAASKAQAAGHGQYSAACTELMTLVIQKYMAYNWEYFGPQLQGLTRKCFSSDPGSFFTAHDGQLIASRKQNELCKSNCGPKGMISSTMVHCWCLCDLAEVQREYAADVEFYRECAQTFKPWTEAATKANDLLNKELGDKIEAKQKALRPGEFGRVGALLDNQYFHAAERIDEVNAHVDGAYQTAADTWRKLQDVIRECRAKPRGDELGSPEDLFGKRPPLLRRVMSESDKPWAFWFFFGELKLGPGDAMNLSLGRPGMASLKLKFNFKTYDFGAGVGLGLNPCKILGPGAGGFNRLFKFELFVMADTEKGISYGLDGRVRTMKVGAISMADQPMIILEN
jgi:tetratricopeptide (TPR) repeat protein